jgi:hypothetical protein
MFRETASQLNIVEKYSSNKKNPPAGGLKIY